MSNSLKLVFCALANLVLGCTASPATPTPKSITCALSAEVALKFKIPAKLGDLPAIDFSYPSKVTTFSFRDDNLLVIAVDEADRSRTRVVVSAQYNKSKGTYDGQYVADYGGNQLQLDNGPVNCKTSR